MQAVTGRSWLGSNSSVGTRLSPARSHGTYGFQCRSRSAAMHSRRKCPHPVRLSLKVCQIRNRQSKNSIREIGRWPRNPSTIESSFNGPPPRAKLGEELIDHNLIGHAHVGVEEVAAVRLVGAGARDKGDAAGFSAAQLDLAVRRGAGDDARAGEE